MSSFMLGLFSVVLAVYETVVFSFQITLPDGTPFSNHRVVIKEGVYNHNEYYTTMLGFNAVPHLIGTLAVAKKSKFLLFVYTLYMLAWTAWQFYTFFLPYVAPGYGYFYSHSTPAKFQKYYGANHRMLKPWKAEVEIIPDTEHTVLFALTMFGLSYLGEVWTIVLKGEWHTKSKGTVKEKKDN
ncbi:hypothetical protein BKA69DRAFT_1101853 [Paraphysoderma sedebokerense]|nr:hypothetical protein BKA69DRAFT_1101853 [Paraphysoderma sedebokerense]